MKARNRAPTEVVGLAFLDVITCGFGAIVLLLLISKPAPDPAVEAAAALVRQIEEVRQLVAGQRARWEAIEREREEEEAQRAAEEKETDALTRAIAETSRELDETKRSNEGLELVKESLERATVETPEPAKERDPEVGGIPVDSEHVIFILDTSGSMKKIWPQVMDVLERVLDIHPQVEGFQVLSDLGNHLVEAYRGRWIPDTPRRRATILTGLEGWGAVSNSSPVEGLRTALRIYANRADKIAIYVFGDDFQRGGSYDSVVDMVGQLNAERAGGAARVRIHAVGFISPQTTTRYATLMREITRRNDGAFLGLPVHGPGR